MEGTFHMKKYEGEEDKGKKEQEMFEQKFGRDDIYTSKIRPKCQTNPRCLKRILPLKRPPNYYSPAKLKTLE